MRSGNTFQGFVQLILAAQSHKVGVFASNKGNVVVIHEDEYNELKGQQKERSKK